MRRPDAEIWVEVAGSEEEDSGRTCTDRCRIPWNRGIHCKGIRCKLNQRTNVATEPGTYATNAKNVFVAGEICTEGQSLVVWAIRECREVAHDVDTSLMGDILICPYSKNRDLWLVHSRPFMIFLGSHLKQMAPFYLLVGFTQLFLFLSQYIWWQAKCT